MSSEEGERKQKTYEDEGSEYQGSEEESEMERALGKKWYEYPPIYNALLAAILTGLTFTLSTLTPISGYLTTLAYILAIVLGGYYWIREGLEELVMEKRIGISILMLVATAGAALVGLWEEAAFLAFLFTAPFHPAGLLRPLFSFYTV